MPGQFFVPGALHRPGYVVVVDQCNSLHLTWFIESRWNLDEYGCRQTVSASGLRHNPINPDLIVHGEKMSEWKHMKSTSESHLCGSGIVRAWEARLHPRALIGDYVRRQAEDQDVTAEYNVQRYLHEMVKICSGGRMAEMMLAFRLEGAHRAVASIVRVDLWTQQYQVIARTTWTKPTGFRCRSELFLRRYLQQYRSSGRDPGTDREISLEGEGKCFWNSPEADCNVVGNEAIRFQNPVSQMQCSLSPVEIIYA